MQKEKELERDGPFFISFLGTSFKRPQRLSFIKLGNIF
jgi:hypothetical protein